MEDSVCQVCAEFEPQAWRKSLCRNCFHSLEEHSEELLAAEAAKDSEAKAKQAASTTATSAGAKSGKTDKTTKARAEGSKNGKKEAGKSGDKTPPSVAPKGKLFSGSPTSKSTTAATSTSLTKAKTEGQDASKQKEKAASKPSEIKLAASSVSALAGKLQSPLGEPGKEFGKDSSKLSDSKGKVLASKSDTKEDDKSPNDDVKDNKSSLLDKPDSRDSPSSKKNSPFSKDMLKSTKDAEKDSKAKELVGAKTSNKTAPPFGKDSLKSAQDKSSTSASPSSDQKKTQDKAETKDSSSTKTSGKVNTPFGRELLKPAQEKQNTSPTSLSDKKKTEEKSEANVGHAGRKENKISGVTSARADTEGSGVSKVRQFAKGFVADGGSGGPEDAGKKGIPAPISSPSADKAPSRAGTDVTDRSQERAGGEVTRGKGKAVEEKVGWKRGTLASPSSTTTSTPSPSASSATTTTTSATTTTTTTASKTSSLRDKFSKEADKDKSKPKLDILSKEKEQDKDKGAKEKEKDKLKEKEEKQSALLAEKDKLKGKEEKTPVSPGTTLSSKPTLSSTKGKFEHGAEDTKSAASKKAALPHSATDDEKLSETTSKLTSEIKQKEQELARLQKELSSMGDKVKKLEGENQSLKKTSVQSQKEEMEKLLNELRSQLSRMEGQCSKLETDNQALINKLHKQEQTVKKDQEQFGETMDNVDLAKDLEMTEKELEDVKDENLELKQQIMELKNEMDEMYDHFRENEHDEFRELQRELDLTAKNCRILQFKLRKAERRNEQVEQDRIHYEDKLRQLQSQFDSEDARIHIQALEEELRVAKEVSVRLHDELDIVEDKRGKTLEENRHLTELLEQTDKKQFRMEMEIDKLKDVIADLRQQLRASSANKEPSPDRKPPPLGVTGKQGSKEKVEYDVSQLMRDLCDSMERENDLKDQLKFTEEEAKMMRKKLAELEDENENLNVQLRKMSVKASKHKKKEKEMEKELDEERKLHEARAAGMPTGQSLHSPESEEYIIGQRKDSTDEDVMNAMQLRVQLDMMEQELMASHKKMDEYELDNENLQAEVKFLQERLEEQRQERSARPEPESPNAYYEDMIKELKQEADDLRWKLIEKDREVERLSVVHTRHKETSHRPAKLKKAKSLDADRDSPVGSSKKQEEQVQQELQKLKEKLDETEKLNENLTQENAKLTREMTARIPSVVADDAAVENVELRDRLRKMEEENKTQAATIKSLTDDLQKLSRDSRSVATSPTAPGPVGKTGMLGMSAAPEAETGPARAATSEEIRSRDTHAQFLILQDENVSLRQNMAEIQNECARLTKEMEKMKTEGKEHEGTKKRTLSGDDSGGSKATPTGAETREELMDKILDMEDEVGELTASLKNKEAEMASLTKEVKSLKNQLQEMKDESRKKELDLLQELDMLHDKNTVLSNLLDIINERAENAEEELERHLNDNATPSPSRSASNVSQVSALSDASVGSDEVFLTVGGDKGGVITRDWETKLKTRIESLERLLAEERQKVTTAEKKLNLAATETVAPSMTDDVKMRLREKELLQEELIETQRHLHIATDQIRGLRERLHVLEDEHHRLKLDYAKLYDEIDRPHDMDTDQAASDADKTLENSLDPEDVFLSHRTSVVEAPNLAALKTAEGPKEDSSELSKLREQIDQFKMKTETLECKVDEINEVWRSKSAASEREKEELEMQLQHMSREVSLFHETIENLKHQLCAKDKAILELEARLREKDHALSRKDEAVRDQAGLTKQRAQDFQALTNQIAQRDSCIKTLMDTIRIRDERLKEKDDILQKLNTSIEDRKTDLKALGEKVQDWSAQVSEKDAVISALRGQLSASGSHSREEVGETDAEKERKKVKADLTKLRQDFERTDLENKELRDNLDHAKRALEEAMLLWDKDRNTLQRDVNILEEKVRMYEAYNTMEKDEMIATLKDESQSYFQEKEALLCELSSMRKEHEVDQRVSREQISRLQSELTQKLKQLKDEVDAGTRQQTEIERLSRQEEKAYRIQQEERILKAEHLAMKVRYETRFEKISRDFNKMLLTVDKLQKEKDLDRDIIQGLQKSLGDLKEKYTHELLRSEEDSSMLTRQLVEIEESRMLAEDMRCQMHDLREQLSDQERLRAELINRFATDRSSWEIDRANLQSNINQLEEQISTYTRAQMRSKDIQVNMEMAWEKERREQKRLLQEAHNLALDLQEQLRSRDESFAHERKELIRQMESDRLTWTREKREKDRKIAEMETVEKRLTMLQKRMKDVQEKHDKDVELWRKEKNDLLRQFAETRHAHARDGKKMEDILAGLIRLREMGAMIASHDIQSPIDGSKRLEEKPPDKTRELDKRLLSYIKEVVTEVSKAANELSHYATLEDRSSGIPRRLSNSESDITKEDLAQMPAESSDVFVISDVQTSAVTMTSTTRLHDVITQRFQHTTTSESRSSEKSSSQRLQTETSKAPATQSNVTMTSEASTPQAAARPVVLQPLTSAIRADRPPSYASGTRSAQTSRATTPDVDFSPSRRAGLPDPPPSFIIPPTLRRGHTPSPTGAAVTFSGARPKRPAMFSKSLSVDSPLVPSSFSVSAAAPGMKSLSANTTPTQPFLVPGMDFPVLTTSQTLTSESGHLQATSGSSFGEDKFSPRTARKRFFAEQPAERFGYQSWPERKSQHLLPSHGVLVHQASLPDPETVRRVVDQEHGTLAARTDAGMKPSTSWDETMHQGITPSLQDEMKDKPGPLLAPSQSQPQTTPSSSKPASAKEKRSFFRKSNSLDSTVGSTIAKVGVTAMPPAAPSGFQPSDLLAAVKGKLKPVFKRKKGDTSKIEQPRPPSPLFIQTDVPDISFGSKGLSSQTPPPAPVNVTQPDRLGPLQAPPTDNSDSTQREGRKQDTRSPRGLREKWRSRSADRAPKTLSVQTDLASPVHIWQFSETAV